MAIGKVILYLRNERNLSQKKLADAIGISQAAIAKIEINRNEATADTIRKLSEFFGVSADYLLELENDYGAKEYTYAGVNAYTTEEQQLVEAFRELPADSKKLVLRMVGVSPATQTSKKKA